jgi:hypothetical protein
MIRNRLYLRLIHRGRAVGLGEGRAGRNDPLFRIHRAFVLVRVSMRLGSMFCFASPPEMYAFTLSARSAARFLRFSFGSAFPTTTSLASGSCCNLFKIAHSKKTVNLG